MAKNLCAKRRIAAESSPVSVPFPEKLGNAKSKCDRPAQTASHGCEYRFLNHFVLFSCTTIFWMNSRSNSGVRSIMSVYRLALAMKPSVLKIVSRGFWMAALFAGIFSARLALLGKPRYDEAREALEFRLKGLE